MKDAACRGIHPRNHKGPDPFFPERNGSRAAERAKMICMDCPVFTQCDNYQKQIQSNYGIWAGEHYSRW